MYHETLEGEPVEDVSLEEDLEAEAIPEFSTLGTIAILGLAFLFLRKKE